MNPNTIPEDSAIPSGSVYTRSWASRVFNWVGANNAQSRLSRPILDMADNHPVDRSSSGQETGENSSQSLRDASLHSSEISSISDSEDPQLVSITRLQDRSGLGNMIRKIRDGFRREDMDMTRFWMPDSNSKECHDCGFKFSAIRRKHHCRICGQIFCNRCCSKKIDGEQIGYSQAIKVRTCNYCYRAVSGYLRTRRQDNEPNELIAESNVNTRSTNRIPETFRDLFNFGGLSAPTNNEATGGFRSPRKSVDESSGLDSPAVGRSAPMYTPYKRKQSLSLRAESYSRTPVHDTIHSNFELNTSNMIRSSLSGTGFSRTEEATDALEDESQEPAWVKEIEQKENLLELIGSDFDFGDSNTDTSTSNEAASGCLMNSSELMKDLAKANRSNLIIPDELEDSCFVDSTQLASVAIGNKTLQPSKSISYEILQKPLVSGQLPTLSNEKLLRNYEQRFSATLQNSFEQLYEKLAKQMLNTDQLSLDWFPHLRNICKQMAESVQPVADMNEQMDIRRNIKIKTIAGGSRSDCVIHNGIAFQKNIAHRKMKRELNNPTILLLSCPLMYQQRSQQKYINLEQLFMQENNYLENLVEKIASYGPNLVIVDKTAAMLAQELLLKKKITLVCNVKSSILRRIARLTGGEIITSLDAQIGCPILGKCHKFFLKTYNPNKTIMFIDGCPPSLGCTLLLRGTSSKSDLKKLKKICYFLVFCDYNWKFEKSLLIQSFAYIPNSIVDHFNQYYKSSSDAHCESRGQNSTQESIGEQSDATTDPLNVINGSDKDVTLATSIMSNQLADEETECVERMRTFIDDLVLNTSPFFHYPQPYLLTKEGECSPERPYFDLSELYQMSRYKQFEDTKRMTLRVDESVMNRQQEKDLEPIETSELNLHDFLRADLKGGTCGAHVQDMLAMFRANGGGLAVLNELGPRGERNKKRTDSNDERLESIKTDAFPFDPFDTRFHQLLPVLFSSFTHSSSSSSYCVSPSIMLMEFYVERDMTLGAYLRRFCFNASRACTCRSSAEDHVTRFANAYGQVHVRLVRLDSTIVTPSPDQIIGWSWCSLCHVSTGNHVWNEQALSISFAKFLQLKLYARSYMRWNDGESSTGCCQQHSLFHDYYQYFAYQDLLAVFIFHSVKLRSICLPVNPLHVHLNIAGHDALKSELQRLHRVGFETMSAIVEQIFSYQKEGKPSNQQQNALLEQYSLVEQAQRHDLKMKLECIQEQLSECTLSDIQKCSVSDQMKILSQFICTLAFEWNEKFQDFEVQRKREEKGLSRKPFLSSSNAAASDAEAHLSNFTLSTQFIRQISDPVQSDDSCKQSELMIRRPASKSFRSQSDHSEPNSLMDGGDKCISPPEVMSEFKNHPKHAKTSGPIALQSPSEVKLKSVANENVSINESQCSHVSDLGTIETSTTSTQRKNGLEVSAVNSSSIGTSSLGSASQAIQIPLRKELSASALNTRQAVKSLFNLLSNTANCVIPSPFPMEQHLMLPMRERLPVIVEDNDFGSIIAYSLTSGEYEKKLVEIQQTKKGGKLMGGPGNGDEIVSNSESAANQITSEHINLQFSDSNSTYYCCVYYAEVFRQLRQKVLQVTMDCNGNETGDHTIGADQHNELGNHSDCVCNSNASNGKCLIDAEEAYIRSLSQTLAWNAKGGKSKASFCKTTNDRFVIKGVLKADLHQFTKMADSYFQYTTNAIHNRKPTLLAKIVGVYEVGCKNSSTGAAYKKHLIVMENIFYGRKISQKFDLKGSEKNRLANKKLAEEVLLDENLTKMIRDQPLYVRAHSKLLLQAAIENDSFFLSNLNVIDYSLLVGLDEERKQIVVGIIDYIQTYTNLKKLETVIKSVGKVLPTVIDPHSYMDRFRAKMDMYFHCLPDQWHDFNLYSLRS